MASFKDMSVWAANSRLIIIAGGLLSLVLALSLHPLSANTPIVEDIKPLPAMQEAQGRALFDANCAQCHGVLADGVDGAGPPLVHPYYRPDHHADIAFYRAAERGVQAHHWPFGDMPKQPQVTRDEMTQIIRYLRQLQNVNGIH